MSETKQFYLGTVLSVLHGRLLCSMDDLYDILNWMTNDTLYTHQLPRAGRVCETFLAETFPLLAAEDVKGAVERFADSLSSLPQNKEALNAAVSQWVDERTAEWDERFDVPRLPVGMWKYRDPFSELVGMVGEDRVIEVTL